LIVAADSAINVQLRRCISLWPGSLNQITAFSGDLPTRTRRLSKGFFGAGEEFFSSLRFSFGFLRQRVRRVLAMLVDLS
jgi:hypothetical protein